MQDVNRKLSSIPIETVQLGSLYMNIPKLLKTHGITKTKFCHQMDIPHQNLKKYMENTFVRIDALFLIKVCYYFECDISDFLEYKPPHHP